MIPAEFDDLYLNRHDTAVLQSCIHILEEAPRNDFEWEWRRARLFHFRAMQTLEIGEHSEAQNFFQVGAQHANIAKKLDVERVEGTFWSGTCELEAAREGSKLVLLRVLTRAQKAIKQAVNIDEEFHFAGPLRVLGRITHQKPPVLGGTARGAISFYERALQIAPRNSTNGIYMADALIANYQYKQASETLMLVIDNADIENWEWETQRDQKIARSWLKSRFD